MKDENRNPLLVACPRLHLGVLPFYQEARQKANPSFIRTILGGSLGLICRLGQRLWTVVAAISQSRLMLHSAPHAIRKSRLHRECPQEQMHPTCDPGVQTLPHL
jgi:hypothetical protein